MRIKVTYNAPLNTVLDKKITEAIESIGAEWYGQGVDLTTSERDLVFEMDE